MSRAALEWYDLLARGLLWAAGIVLALALIAAVVTAGSDSTLPLLEEAERQGRGFIALAALGGGVTSAGLLAGLGAILRMLVTERLARLGDEPERDEPEPPPPAPRRESRARREPKPKREPAAKSEG